MRKKNTISMLFIISGIIVMMIPIGLQYYSKYQQNKMLEEVRTEIEKNKQSSENKEPVDSNLSKDANINEAASQFNDLELENAEEDESKKEDSKKKESKKGDMVDQILKYQEIIGIIEIDKINITFPVVEGAERANIRAAIGHIKDTVGFGEKGNCVLAGHRGGVYGTFFKHIDKLKKKDKVKLTDTNGKEYTYSVYDQFVVKPTDMYIVNAIEDEKTLTLVSCEAKGTKRLIIRCHLVE